MLPDAQLVLRCQLPCTCAGGPEGWEQKAWQPSSQPVSRSSPSPLICLKWCKVNYCFFPKWLTSHVPECNTVNVTVKIPAYAFLCWQCSPFLMKINNTEPNTTEGSQTGRCASITCSHTVVTIQQGNKGKQRGVTGSQPRQQWGRGKCEQIKGLVKQKKSKDMRQDTSVSEDKCYKRNQQLDRAAEPEFCQCCQRLSSSAHSRVFSCFFPVSVLSLHTNTFSEKLGSKTRRSAWPAADSPRNRLLMKFCLLWKIHTKPSTFLAKWEQETSPAAF